MVAPIIPPLSAAAAREGFRFRGIFGDPARNRAVTMQFLRNNTPGMGAGMSTIGLGDMGQQPTPFEPAPGAGEHLQMLRDFERVASMANQQRFRPMPTQVPMPTNPAEVPLPAMPTGAPMPTGPAEVPMMPQVGGAAYTGNEQRFRPMPAAASGGGARGGAMQGPPMPPEFNMPGFAKGMGYSTPGMSAQQYADQFAGGDVSKVKARQIMLDGQLVNDFYTKGLLDGLLGGPSAPQPLQGTPANVPLPPQRPAEFGPSYQGGGLLSNLPFIGGLFGG